MQWKGDRGIKGRECVADISCIQGDSPTHDKGIARFNTGSFTTFRRFEVVSRHRVAFRERPVFRQIQKYSPGYYSKAFTGILRMDHWLLHWRLFHTGWH
jgi:hypothetical protein